MRDKKLPIFKRGDYFYCYVRTRDDRRVQRALHIRGDGSAAAERAAIAAYWQEQARATAGEYDRERGTRKTLGKAIVALQEAQELAGLTDNVHENTHNRSRWLLRHFTANFDLRELSQEKMVEYATQAITGRRATDDSPAVKPRKSSTVRLELDIIVRAARAVGLNPPKRPKMKDMTKRQKPLSHEQLRKFFMALHPRQRLLGLSLVTLGCRASEIAKIPDDGIDWANRTMWINGTKTRGSRRQLPIPDELFAFMCDMRERGEWAGFPKQSRTAVYLVVRKACIRAFGEARCVNDVRGTWSTLAALEGVPADIRAAYQGNSPEMQANTYAQPVLMPEAMREAVAHGVPRIRKDQQPVTAVPKQKEA